SPSAMAPPPSCALSWSSGNNRTATRSSANGWPGTKVRFVKLRAFLAERRRQKAHARYEEEKRRQAALEGRDAQEAVRDAVRGSVAPGGRASPRPRPARHSDDPRPSSPHARG